MGRAKAARPTRKQKAGYVVQPVIYEVDVPLKPQTIQKLEPKNQNQKTALSYLNTGTPIVFLTGSAGTGKSLLAAYRAATQINTKKIKKIYLVRPAVGLGKSIGLLPGEIEEKLAPYFAQIVEHLRKFLGPHLQYLLEKKDIEMKPAEYLRSMSFEDCIVIFEESQNFTHEDMECCLTRLGGNCQLIFTGDTKQNDLKVESGLDTTVALVERMLQTHPSYLNNDDIDELDAGFGIVRFLPDDVVRHGLTRGLVKMYFNND